MHLEIYKLTFSFREEFMVSENLIGEKFMIPCKNIHPWIYWHRDGGDSKKLSNYSIVGI